jgi:hypothetical protein
MAALIEFSPWSMHLQRSIPFAETNNMHHGKSRAAQIKIILQRQMPWAEQLATEGDGQNHQLATEGGQTQQLAAESSGQVQAWLSG